ncbi:PFB0765w-like [Asbolus verrucosus]|uniref:PFB0765w-like n=1 Tax=Asbolus verrucosus TaxID=1661398 RepID=A0A482VX58_ASBVE|nr:PFB0765w-like [Asbolus verrucosus]
MKIKKEIEEENNLTIMGLSKKLQNSQQQCKDLFLLGEAIKKESDHFKERIQQLEINKLNLSSDDFQIKKMDKDTLMVHLEKFKRMLLDKAIEMNTLKAKLKFYDSDMDELFEYRKILSKMYTCEVKLCSNTEHEELLIFMQRQLQSYEQAVEDRNNQIMNLNMVNKELQEKIEEMIQQTRTDIRNLSQKYSLPQLETMSNELKNAEETIHDLKKQLMEKHETSYQELTTKLEKACKHNEHLQQMAINEKQNFEEKLAEMKNDLKSMEEEKIKLEELIKSLKQSELKLAGENEKVKFELQKIYQKLGISETDIIESDADIHELNLLRSKCGQVHDQLQQVAMHLEKMSPKRAAYCDENMSVVLKMKKQILNYLKLLKTEDLQKTEIEDKLKEWDNMLSNFIDNLRSANNMMETSIKESELKDSVEDLTNAKTMLEGEKFALEYQLKSRSSELESAQREIRILMENKSILMKESEDNARLIQKLTDQVSNLEKGLKIVEENKIELEKQLENTQKQLNESKQETIKMHKELGEMNDNFVRKNLFKELKDVESELEQSRIDNKITFMVVSGSEIFRKSIQAEILKAELILRERLEEENIKNMQKIEEQYRNVLTQKTEIYSKEKEKWKSQEMIYRKRFAAVLDECRKKMEALEKENINLITQINELIKEYKTYKIHITNDMEQYTKIIGKYKKNMETLNKEWKDLFGYYVSSYTNIEKRSQKKIKNLQKTINMSQTELNLIESIYDEKIKKIKSEWKSTNRI